MSRLTIEASTPLCLLQDAGRFGVRHLGVTQGGAADWRSMCWANWLLGNGLDVPVIEITLGGFTVVAEDDCVLALAGADLGAQIDGQPLAPWRSFRLHKGPAIAVHPAVAWRPGLSGGARWLRRAEGVGQQRDGGARRARRARWHGLRWPRVRR